MRGYTASGSVAVVFESGKRARRHIPLTVDFGWLILLPVDILSSHITMIYEFFLRT